MFQSGFRTNHRTDTARLKILIHIRINLDPNKPSARVLLVLDAAFDTVDHPILLNRLSESVGLSGTGLSLIYAEENLRTITF